MRRVLLDYRIEDLAEAAGTTVRNIRAYQDKGILPPPRREGRIAWYGDMHLARLRLVGALLERGYSLGNIGEILALWERGNDLGDLLNLEEAITQPFSDEDRAPVTLEEIATLFGTPDPLVLARAVQIGLVEVEGLGLVAPSMRLLRAGAELHREGGIPLLSLIEEFERLRAEMDQTARRFVEMMLASVFPSSEDGVLPPREAKRMAERIARVRPLASLVVTTELARALERQVRARMGDHLGQALKKKKTRRAV